MNQMLPVQSCIKLKNYGKCEVILYSPDHNTTLPQLSIEHIYKLVNLWVERFNELSKDKD